MNRTRLVPLILLLICLVVRSLARFLSDTTSTTTTCVSRNCERQMAVKGPATNHYARNAIMYDKVPALFQKEYEKIDSDYDEARCERYGYSYRATQMPRRVFFGSMVADEYWDVFQAHATEVYNVYHVVALLESNTTHMNTPREMRWKRGSQAWKAVVQDELFGGETKTVLEYWLEDFPKLLGMDRECAQRAAIVDLWIKEGMTKDDVGVMADIDEIVSRDFLRAVQVCDIPQFRPGQDCSKPKLIALAISFESSPECIKRDAWFHPDLISGECIDGVGDPTNRAVAVRKIDGIHGERTDEYGGRSMNGMRDDIKESGRWPLYNGPDIRLLPGSVEKPAQRHGKRGLYQKGNEEIWGVAFHLHNFFDNFSTLRNKYHSYGHGESIGFNGALFVPLTQLGPDIDTLVRCAKKLPNSAHPYKTDIGKCTFEGGFDGTGGNKPIFFLNETYRRERHALLTRIVLEDENRFGSEYSTNGTWVGNTDYGTRTQEKRKQQENDHQPRVEQIQFPATESTVIQ